MRKYVVEFEAELVSDYTNDTITMRGHLIQRAHNDGEAHEKAMRALIKRFNALCKTKMYEEYVLNKCETLYSYRVGNPDRKVVY